MKQPHCKQKEISLLSRFIFMKRLRKKVSIRLAFFHYESPVPSYSVARARPTEAAVRYLNASQSVHEVVRIGEPSGRG